MIPGNTASFAPKWAFTGGITYQWHFNDRRIGRFNVGAKHTTANNTGSDLNPYKTQPAYTLLNARLVIGAVSKRWQVELLGNNLTDKTYMQVGYDAPLQTGSVNGFPGRTAHVRPDPARRAVAGDRGSRRAGGFRDSLQWSDADRPLPHRPARGARPDGRRQSHKPFRLLCKRLGAGLAASEMTSADPSLWQTRKSLKRMDHAGEPDPVSVQIAGHDPAMLAEAARFNVANGAQMIHINMGCPAKKVCKRGPVRRCCRTSRWWHASSRPWWTRSRCRSP
ncbi:tRNA-dihydrouridine synthase B [Rhodanobacter lindaniclasticus]